MLRCAKCQAEGPPRIVDADVLRDVARLSCVQCGHEWSVAADDLDDQGVLARLVCEHSGYRARLVF